VSDVFGISISALQAYQTALAVTSNNIANANTPGYAKESVNLTAAVPQTDGSAPIGAGVQVASVTRAFSQLAENQLNSSQSTLGQLNSLQNYTGQIDNIVGTSAGGLSTALQNYYNAWSTVANNPTSTAARQALLSQAQSVASAFASTNTQLQGLNSSINQGIQGDVTQINSIGTSIAALNQQIVTATANAGGQPPNDLIDQRDQLVSNLSQLVGISTTTDSTGAVNVFVGNGQPLVLNDQATALTTVGNQFNASQLEVASSANPKVSISSQITGGDLGGLLASRTQAVDPAVNQLGQIAIALNQTANAQQNAGLDLSGNLGANMFSVAGPQASASANNSDNTTAAVSITNVGALTANNYLLSYQGGAYSLTNAATGSAVAFTGNGTADECDRLRWGLAGSGERSVVPRSAGNSMEFHCRAADHREHAAARELRGDEFVPAAGHGRFEPGPSEHDALFACEHALSELVYAAFHGERGLHELSGGASRCQP